MLGCDQFYCIVNILIRIYYYHQISTLKINNIYISKHPVIFIYVNLLKSWRLFFVRDHYKKKRSMTTCNVSKLLDTIERKKKKYCNFTTTTEYDFCTFIFRFFFSKNKKELLESFTHNQMSGNQRQSTVYVNGLYNLVIILPQRSLYSRVHRFECSGNIVGTRFWQNLDRFQAHRTRSVKYHVLASAIIYNRFEISSAIYYALYGTTDCGDVSDAKACLQDLFRVSCTS